VLSCGGTIHQLTQSNIASEIYTVMGGDPFWFGDRVDSPIVRDVHTRWNAGDNPVEVRREEDKLAAQKLGATTTQSSWPPDCIYRAIEYTTSIPCYPTAETLFGEIHPFDYAATSFHGNQNLNFSHERMIYAPLGVGHHVDHQIVRNIGITLNRLSSSLALKFYEEYPYNRDKMATQRALDLLKSIAPDLSLELEMVELTAADIQAKIEAIACYRSQISSFWPSLEAMEAEVRGIPVERFWRAICN
jgi:LmbE family N-acetylglucosaminyl deacetylase